MPIIAIAVVVLLWPAVAHAKDCMTRAEAREAYRTSYLYWHGKSRCWDASPRASDRHQQKVGAALRRRVEVSHKEGEPKPEASPVQTPAEPTQTATERMLTPDDLRKFANSMAAMTAAPTATILDRWPDEELPQLRAKPTAVEQPSLMNTRTIIMVVIMFMALSAVLIEVTARRRRSA